MIKKIIAVLIVVLATATWSACEYPEKIEPIQEKDVNYRCMGVVLAVNEAEHYRAIADDSSSQLAFFAPMCKVANYKSRLEAINATNARIDYLSHMYDLMDCAGTKPTIIPMQMNPTYP